MKVINRLAWTKKVSSQLRRFQVGTYKIFLVHVHLRDIEQKDGAKVPRNLYIISSAEWLST